MVLRKIGSGVTDVNGVAVMTKNAVGTTISHSYTGSGAGKINLVAKPAAYDSVTLTVNPRRINDIGGAYSLSATLLNGGTGVSGEVVTFELRKVSDDSLVDTLTGTTNSSGIATVSYSGKYSGLLYIRAFCGTVVSEPITVLDTIMYIENTDTTVWHPNYSNVTVEASDDSVHFTHASGTTDYISIKKNGVEKLFDGTKDWIIEFDFKTNTIGLYLIDNSGANKNVCADTGSTWKHHKWVYNATSKQLTPYIDGTAQTTVDLTSTNITSFGFRLIDWTNDIDAYIKNWKIYNG